MYFPIANIQINPLIPPLVAFAISFFTSMGGVSGAFLLLPFQVSILGFSSPAVSSTNQLFNIVAIPGGVYRYFREGRMVWPLAWVVIIGTLPGVFLGAIIRIQYLPNPKNFKVFASSVLIYIAMRLFLDLVRKKKNPTGQKNAEEEFRKIVRDFNKKKESAQKQSQPGQKLRGVKSKSFSLHQISYEFYGQEFNVPTKGIMLLSFVVGMVGGVYGIGGGAIMAPFFVTFYNLPIYTIAGATLLGTFITSVAGVAFYQTLALFYPNQTIAPDYLLGMLFGLGGFWGIYLGARFQKYVPARIIKWILAICLVFIGAKYIIEFF
jgi:hypothetical protein